MAKSNLPADLAELTRDLEPDDAILSDDELSVISLIANLTRAPTFSKFPGSTILRTCDPGRVLCYQAEAGATAFYILTQDDVDSLRKMQAVLALASPIDTQLGEIDVELAKTKTAESSGDLADEALHQLEARRRELTAQKESLAAEKQELEQQKQQLVDDVVTRSRAAADLAESAPDQVPDPPQMAVVHLSVDTARTKKSQPLFKRFLHLFRRQHEQVPASKPKYIPIDGPTHLDPDSMRAPLRAGDVFGEMSCINRSPRSATVSATENCLMLEMLVNIFDLARDPRKNPVFQKQVDAAYRRRSLELHVRDLSILEHLTDEEFNLLKSEISLEIFRGGDVLFDQHHEPADSFYIVRKGLVQVVQDMCLLFGPDDLTSAVWNDVASQLTAALEMPDAANVAVADALAGDLQAVCARIAAGDSTPEDYRELRTGLNQFIRNTDVLDQLLKATKLKKRSDFLQAIGLDGYASQFESFDETVADWSQIERRIFQRLLLESLCESIPQRSHALNKMRTLTYLRSGQHLGEIGVLERAPRSTTCIAYEHPGDAVESRVEVVKITAETLLRLVDSSPALAQHIQQVIEQYKQGMKQAESQTLVDVTSTAQTLDFERLGLIQGQQLMLIDLDRCTRCGECVNACVDGHNDGHTRLYLEGPRIEKYLVPLTCRRCLDPVCMTGCPVGSINLGGNGEIRIESWCIGCEQCADQCPYGSIHMNATEPSHSATTDASGQFKTVTQQAAVCDLCSSTRAQQPLCVYACPHDAAMRVNSQEFFFNHNDTD